MRELRRKEGDDARSASHANALEQTRGVNRGRDTTLRSGRVSCFSGAQRSAKSAQQQWTLYTFVGGSRGV